MNYIVIARTANTSIKEEFTNKEDAFNFAMGCSSLGYRIFTSW